MEASSFWKKVLRQQFTQLVSSLDLASSTREFGFQGIIRIFFETSQARGPQDAAGGLLKNQADMAIIRGRVTIQNAFIYKFTSILLIFAFKVFTT
jgi:hypothetical protein